MSDTELPQWYLGIDGEAKGPLPMSEVKSLFASGKANGKTQAWTAGMGDWVEAQTLDAFKALLTPPPMKKPGPPALPTVKKVEAPAAAAAPEPVKVVGPEAMMEKELGLTPQKIESMAILAVELAGQTRVRLKLTSPPPRMGLIDPSHHTTRKQ